MHQGCCNSDVAGVAETTEVDCCCFRRVFAPQEAGKQPSLLPKTKRSLCITLQRKNIIRLDMTRNESINNCTHKSLRDRGKSDRYDPEVGLNCSPIPHPDYRSTDPKTPNMKISTYSPSATQDSV